MLIIILRLRIRKDEKDWKEYMDSLKLKKKMKED